MKGFTLIEIISTLLIVSVLLVVGLTAFVKYEGWLTAQKSVTEIKNAIEQARDYSVAQPDEISSLSDIYFVGIKFNQSTNPITYQYFYSQCGDVPLCWGQSQSTCNDNRVNNKLPKLSNASATACTNRQVQGFGKVYQLAKSIKINNGSNTTYWTPTLFFDTTKSALAYDCNGAGLTAGNCTSMFSPGSTWKVTIALNGSPYKALKLNAAAGLFYEDVYTP